MEVTNVLETVGIVVIALGFCVFGVTLLQHHIKQLITGNFRRFIVNVTQSPVRAALLGLLFAGATGENISITVVISSLISEGVISLGTAYPIFLWSNVGTCSIVFLTLINIKVLVLYTTGIASFIVSFAKSSKVRLWGGVVLGISLVLYGITTIKGLSINLESSAEFQKIAAHVTDSLLMAFAVGFAARLLTQSTFVLVLLGASGLTSNIFSLEQLASLYVGSSLASASLVFIIFLGATKAFRRIVLVQLAYHLSLFLVFSIWISIEHYSGIPTLTTFIHYLGFSPYLQSALFMVIYMTSGVVFMFALKPLVLKFIDTYCYVGLKILLNKPKYIHKHALNDPLSAMGLIDQESLRLIKRFPSYLQEARARGSSSQQNIETQFKNTEDIELEIESFLNELGNTETTSEFRMAILRQSQDIQLIKALNFETYRFAKGILSVNNPSDHMKKLQNNFIEFMTL